MNDQDPSGDLKRYFHDPSGCVVIRRDRRKVIQRCDAAGCAQPLFVKIYRRGGLAWTIRNTVALSAGEREHRICRLLRERGIPVPKPVGSAEERDRWGLVRGSLYAAEWVDDMVSLRDLTVDLFCRLPIDRSLMDALCDSLGRFVARLHTAGVKAYDLNAGNFLVRREAHGAFELLLVDYERISLSRTIPRRRKIANLAQVSAFLLPLSGLAFEGVCASYLAAGGRDDQGDLVRAVGKRAREMAAQWEQRLDDRFRRIGEQRDATLKS